VIALHNTYLALDFATVAAEGNMCCHISVEMGLGEALLNSLHPCTISSILARSSCMKTTHVLLSLVSLYTMGIIYLHFPV